MLAVLTAVVLTADEALAHGCSSATGTAAGRLSLANSVLPTRQGSFSATTVTLLNRLKDRARQLRREIHAVYLAARDPRTPWVAKAVAAVVVGYAFSPVDLIPDFVPVLGYLDDLVLLPIGIALVLRLVPQDVMADARAAAERAALEGTPVNRTAAVVIVLIWLALAVGGAVLVAGLLRVQPPAP